jgi:hypothetical protein
MERFRGWGRVVIMKKLVLLIGTVMLVSMVLIPVSEVSASHAFRSKEHRGCPKGYLPNAAGTTCTNKKTGVWHKAQPAYNRLHNPKTHPCPEFWKLAKDKEHCKKRDRGI